MPDSRAVTTVRAVVHTTSLMGSNPQISHNHWPIFLLISNGEAGFITGNLEISRHEYILTILAIRFWDFSTVQGLAV
jgi:hypothetical protein